jgi:hypothetical protein
MRTTVGRQRPAPDWQRQALRTYIGADGGGGVVAGAVDAPL